MAKQTIRKLNWLEQNVPQGLLVTASWLTEHGYSSSLRTQYVAAGWLEQPARGVFRRPAPRGHLRWEHAVISLQMLLQFPVVVGGRTALEIQGYSHFLMHERREVHLYGNKAPPSWLDQLPLKVRFVFHKDTRVFRNDSVTRALTNLGWDIKADKSHSIDPLQTGFTRQPLGTWDWPLTLSRPERAILEMLDELPKRESFHQAEKLMEGLANLSPRRLQKLLEDCTNVKVKRLFFFFADRQNHAWLKHVDRSRIDLGKGKRVLVRGGRYDPTYKITVPEDLDAVQ